MAAIKVPGLRFVSLAIDGRESISTDLSDEEAFGIYAYEFTDGMWYVGKSIDVRKRHVQHMHDYRHEDPPRIPKQMLWAQVKGDAQQLDYAETAAIAWFESKGYPLTNTMKTGRPKGNTEVMVDTGAGWGVPIPWDRENLPKSKRGFEFESDPGKLKRFNRLREEACYDKLIELLSWYVGKTIPAPADTAGTLWIVTALPTTNNNARLCTVSCQNAETLVFVKGDDENPEPWGFVNVKQPEGGKLPRWPSRIRSKYGTLPKCVTFTFDSMQEANKLLKDERALDCCYRANAELMRKGASMYIRYNNPYLTQAILERL
ncbi:MAG: GIY-YIG nuclease family protein [Eggerthellaceae bacterium]|nr:GIY-YIG nuclease family protein [Eggerthellaceae bacterium]